MTESSGLINVYVCDFGHKTVTRNIDQGTTPFMIGCPTCKAAGTPLTQKGFRSVMARSSIYRVDQSLAWTHEWYRPETTEGLDPATAEHVNMGGLLLRQAIE